MVNFDLSSLHLAADTRYLLAMVAVDEAGNISPVSNIATILQKTSRDDLPGPTSSSHRMTPGILVLLAAAYLRQSCY